MGLLLVIAIVLTILKLFNLISWSWVAVCAPIWLPLALALFVDIMSGISKWIDRHDYRY